MHPPPLSTSGYRLSNGVQEDYNEPMLRFDLGKVMTSVHAYAHILVRCRPTVHIDHNPLVVSDNPPLHSKRSYLGSVYRRQLSVPFESTHHTLLTTVFLAPFHASTCKHAVPCTTYLLHLHSLRCIWTGCFSESKMQGPPTQGHPT